MNLGSSFSMLGGKTLFSEGTPIRLPAKEFDTLLLLVEHNRRALTKEEMMSAIWNDSFVEEGNLAKQIYLMMYLKVAPNLDPLRDDRRFAELVSKAGLG